MPINVALILGEEATAHYHETGKVPSGTWLSRHDGEVCHRTYPDRRTYEAVREAISKMAGQQDGTAVVLEELPEPLPAKELWAFVFPDSRLPRNATDAQILADYQQEHEQDEAHRQVHTRRICRLLQRRFFQRSGSARPLHLYRLLIAADHTDNP